MKTVKELIEELQKLDSTKIVVLQGCDCEGQWNGHIEDGITHPIIRDEYGITSDIEYSVQAVILGRDR